MNPSSRSLTATICLLVAGLLLAGSFSNRAKAAAQSDPHEAAVAAMIDGPSGEIAVEVAFEETNPEAVEVLIRASEVRAMDSTALRLTACFAFVDHPDRCFDSAGTGQTIGRQIWAVRLLADLPDDPVAVGVLVRETGPDGVERFGSGSADVSADETLRIYLPEILDLRPTPTQPVAASSTRSQTLRLVAPPDAILRGQQTFRVLVSDPRVVAVLFELNGLGVDVDRRAPFSARIDLGPDGGQQRITARGLGTNGIEIGSDVVDINVRRQRDRVRLAAVGGADDRLDVEAQITVAPGRSVEQVVFSFRDQEVAVDSDAPFRASIAIGTPQPSDYIQAVAHLDNGDTIEDVLLLSGGSTGEQIEVYLTEIFVVATNGDQELIEDLEAGEIALSVGRRAQAIERFARADELPITVGLVIDTSTSMFPLIPDTQAAAGRFLSGVLRPGDRAFIVDFATVPRLAHAVSEDQRSLINRLAVLNADGFTALFDSIVYSTLEFPSDGRRRALIVLTDGDDYKSKFGPGNAIEHALAAGSPVYIISLAGIQLGSHPYMQFKDAGSGVQKIEPPRKRDLELVADATGGRVFYLTDRSELQATYDQILKELTHQYLVTFSTPIELTEEERQRIRVEPAARNQRAKSLRLRFTVGRPESR